jgi:transcriptional regulator
MLPSGALALLVLSLLRSGPLHGYAIAQRIHLLSNRQLSVEEGSLYPLLQKLLLNGWVKASWTRSESGREVRQYRLTRDGKRELESAIARHEHLHHAINLVLEKA